MPDYITKEDYKKIINHWRMKSDHEKITHENQINCAENINEIFWKGENKNKNSRVVLGAQPQSGKTGVILEAIRDAIYEWTGSDIGKSPLPMSEWQIIVFICIADNALKEQTEQRIKEAFYFDEDLKNKFLKNNSIIIEHGSSISKKLEEITLKNKKRLVILDESHLNKNEINGKKSGLMEMLSRFGVMLDRNVCEWESKEGSIKLLEVSATAYAEGVVDHKLKGEHKFFSKILMEPGKGYYGVREIKTQDRFKERPDIIENKKFCQSAWIDIYNDYINQVRLSGSGVCLIRASSEKEGKFLKSEIEKRHKDENPFIKIFSAKQKNIDAFDMMVRQSSLSLDEIAKSKMPTCFLNLSTEQQEDFLKSSIEMLMPEHISKEINGEFLETQKKWRNDCKPSRIYFIIIDSFRAGKTFGKDMGGNIRCWFEGKSMQNDTMIQSIGRCFGYGRSSEQFSIYCDLEKVDDYIDFVEGRTPSNSGNGVDVSENRFSNIRFAISEWEPYSLNNYINLKNSNKIKSIMFRDIPNELKDLEKRNYKFKFAKATNSNYVTNVKIDNMPTNIVREKRNSGFSDRDETLTIRSYYLDEPNLILEGVDRDWEEMRNAPQFSNLLGKVCVPILMLKPEEEREGSKKLRTKKASAYGADYETTK